FTSDDKTSTLTITKLARQDLIPDTDSYQEVFTQSDVVPESEFTLGDIQPRLHYALEQLLPPLASSRFLLAKAPEEVEYLGLIADAAVQLLTEGPPMRGGEYRVASPSVAFAAATGPFATFVAKRRVVLADWVGAKQLSGCLRQFNT